MVSEEEFEALKEEYRSFKGIRVLRVETSELIEQELESTVNNLQNEQLNQEEKILALEQAILVEKSFAEKAEAERHRLTEKIVRLEQQLKETKSKYNKLESLNDDLEQKLRISEERSKDWQGQYESAYEELVICKMELEDKAKIAIQERPIDRQHSVDLTFAKNRPAKSSAGVVKENAISGIFTRPQGGHQNRGSMDNVSSIFRRFSGVKDAAHLKYQMQENSCEAGDTPLKKFLLQSRKTSDLKQLLLSKSPSKSSLASKNEDESVIKRLRQKCGVSNDGPILMKSKFNLSKLSDIKQQIDDLKTKEIKTSQNRYPFEKKKHVKEAKKSSKEEASKESKGLTYLNQFMTKNNHVYQDILRRMNKKQD